MMRLFLRRNGVDTARRPKTILSRFVWLWEPERIGAKMPLIRTPIGRFAASQEGARYPLSKGGGVAL
jgi:hypothetical protein